MKRIISASLLVLLLYNMFGLAVGIFFFEKDFQIATEVQSDDEYKLIKYPVVNVPYNTTWENTDDVSGLLKTEGKFYNITHQKIENDTVYLTLKTNISARDRFLELADQITRAEQDDPGQSVPLRKAIHSLVDLAKIYWVHHYQNLFGIADELLNVFTSYRHLHSHFISPFPSEFSLPPEA
ncbi:hypothetical protein [Dyadobacter sp. NIV53]|uniref:hypothetical protein n=1 Tax=Dyadobacter sp. NIV53 TaxID=2861765 RepID=UPI001C8774E6|nr:hypothetical protein [Dyadobacter sp. NIV53]